MFLPSLSTRAIKSSRALKNGSRTGSVKCQRRNMLGEARVEMTRIALSRKKNGKYPQSLCQNAQKIKANRQAVIKTRD